jgi:hypothetical protein
LKPKRIQRRRTKGWRMPGEAIYVGRPTEWGNPWPVKKSMSLSEVLIAYERYLVRQADTGALDLAELRAHDLVCWCPLDRPCHADILLRLANR